MTGTISAMKIDGITPAENVRTTEISVPEAGPGHMLIRIMAFGMNYFESLLRLEEIGSEGIACPVILGIECVGKIADPSDSGLEAG